MPLFLNDFLLQGGDTALHRAALSGRKHIIKLLLHAGADTNIKNKVSNDLIRYDHCNDYGDDVYLI